MDLLYPLRRLVRANRQRKRRKAEGKCLRAYLADCDAKTAVLPGTPLHVNLGDSAIFLAQKAFLEECGYRVKEVTWADSLHHRKLLRKLIPKDTLIAQLGGGNIGNQWLDGECLRRQLLEDYPQNPSMVFPQTAYFTPDGEGERQRKISGQVYSRHEKLTVVAREQRSYAQLQQMCPGVNVLLTPDIVLSATMSTFGAKEQQREGILFCMRADLERSTTDEMQARLDRLAATSGKAVRRTDMYAAQEVTTDNRAALVRAKMEEFAGAELVITDRLHGMIFATLTGTPCLVFTNSNHKISGTYEWLRVLPHICYADSIAEAERIFPTLLQTPPAVYDGSLLKEQFAPLKALL